MERSRRRIWEYCPGRNKFRYYLVWWIAIHSRLMLVTIINFEHSVSNVIIYIANTISALNQRHNSCTLVSLIWFRGRHCKPGKPGRTKKQRQNMLHSDVMTRSKLWKCCKLDANCRDLTETNISLRECEFSRYCTRCIVYLKLISKEGIIIVLLVSTNKYIEAVSISISWHK